MVGRSLEGPCLGLSIAFCIKLNTNLGGEVTTEVRRFYKKNWGKSEKMKKEIKTTVSFEVVEICGIDIYVKCSLEAVLSDENVLVNIWSTLVDQIAYFGKIDFWSTFLKKIKISKKSKILVNT